MPAAHIRTILFDLDGTLIDHIPTIHACYAYTLPKVGLPAPTPQQVKNAIGGGLEDAMSKLVPKEKFAAALSIYREHWQQHQLDGVTLLPGALELLRQLHQKKLTLAVLTNKVGSSSREICRHLHIAQYLQLIVGAKDTPWLKPDPRLTQYVLRQLHANPSTTAIVGDSPWDIQTAIQSHLLPLAVTTGSHLAPELRAHGATQIFPDLPTLQKTIFPTP